MDHTHDETLFDDINVLASSPSPDDNMLSRSRFMALRARRNLILPALSTSPSSAPAPNSEHLSSPSSSAQPTSPVNNPPDLTSVSAALCCTISSPIPIPSSKNKVPTAKELESQCSSGSPSVDISDFECSLCIRVFFQPVTTVCGHVFCKQCLFSALKYSLHCPLCRHKLEGSSPSSASNMYKYSVNVVLMNMIEKYFPKELKERLDEEGQWQKPENPTKQSEEEAIVPARPASPSWSCILPSLRSTCNVILSCGGF